MSCILCIRGMVQQIYTGDKFRGAANRNVWLSSWVTEVNGVNAFIRPQASLSLTCFTGRWGQGTKRTKVRSEQPEGYTLLRSCTRCEQRRRTQHWLIHPESDRRVQYFACSLPGGNKTTRISEELQANSLNIRLLDNIDKRQFILFGWVFFKLRLNYLGAIGTYSGKNTKKK